MLLMMLRSMMGSFLRPVMLIQLERSPLRRSLLEHSLPRLLLLDCSLLLRHLRPLGLFVLGLLSLQKGIDENWEAAIEYNPEAFGRVVMLYVDKEVNRAPLKFGQVQEAPWVMF